MGMHVAMHGRKRMFEIGILLVALIAASVYCYRWLTSSRVLSFDDKSRPFNASLLSYLTALDGEPNDQNEKLSNWAPMFVTATSENHFRELRGMVHSMQSKYPDARFVVYDLGLTAPQRSEVQGWCNARYISLDFDRYPQHARNLLNYAWKPLIIAEQLQELGTFFWLDASARLTCDDLSIFPRSVLNGSVEPFLQFGHTGHSVFAATHQGMLEYFATDDVELLKITEMKLATIMFISDSSYTRAVLKWVLLCALTNDCIAPDGSSLVCEFKDRYKDYGQCHRFDQSALGLVRVHLLYLQGYYKLLHGGDHPPVHIDSEQNDNQAYAEQLRTLSTEWERRYEVFTSCFGIERADHYDGEIRSCKTGTTLNKP